MHARPCRLWSEVCRIPMSTRCNMRRMPPLKRLPHALSQMLFHCTCFAKSFVDYCTTVFCGFINISSINFPSRVFHMNMMIQYIFPILKGNKNSPCLTENRYFTISLLGRGSINWRIGLPFSLMQTALKTLPLLLCIFFRQWWSIIR